MEQFTPEDQKIESNEGKGFFSKIKEKAGSVLKIGAIPVLFSVFLASCEEKEKGPDKATLQKLESEGKVEKITDIASLEDIIEKAKAEGKTLFVVNDTTEGRDINTRVDIDTLENIVKYESNKETGEDFSFVKTNYQITKDKIAFVEEAGGSGGIAGATGILVADKETQIITNAMADQGVDKIGYLINKHGQQEGSIKAVEDAKEKFSTGLKAISQTMANAQR